MCLECGCGQKGPYRVNGRLASEDVPSPLEESINAAVQQSLQDRQGSGSAPSKVALNPHTHLEVNLSVLTQNDRIAERNRKAFQAHGLKVLNVVSSPGAGKTTLLQKTLQMLRGKVRAAVVVGDLATDNDAERLRATGAPVIQITTGTLCHLEAEMISKAIAELDLAELDLLIIENVGNLVCPASFDLGESVRVALLSTTEGEDKPLKYPPIFQNADAVVLTKLDLSEAVEFDHSQALSNLRQASPKARVFEVSAKTGGGMESWCGFLADPQPAVASPNAPSTVVV